MGSGVVCAVNGVVISALTCVCARFDLIVEMMALWYIICAIRVPRSMVIVEDDVFFTCTCTGLYVAKSIIYGITIQWARGGSGCWTTSMYLLAGSLIWMPIGMAQASPAKIGVV